MAEFTAHQQKICGLVKRYIALSNKSQEEISRTMNMSSSALNQMLNCVVSTLPLERFLQIAKLLHISQQDVSEIFSLYLLHYSEKFTFDVNCFELNIKNNVGSTNRPDSSQKRKDLHKKLDRIPDAKLDAVNVVLDALLNSCV